MLHRLLQQQHVKSIPKVSVNCSYQQRVVIKIFIIQLPAIKQPFKICAKLFACAITFYIG